METQLFTQMNEVEALHWWFVARRAIVKKVLITLLQPKTKRQILEIGCGTGGNFQLLSELGEVYATELDEEARKLAAAKKIAMVNSGALPDDIPFQQPFDLICLLDVLEHIEDDNSAVRNLTSLLANDGLVLITVPAYQWLWSYHDTLHHHKRRYTKNQLTALVEKNGFQVIYSSYFNTLLFPLILITRKISAMLNKNNSGSDADMPNPLINKSLNFIFCLEQYLIPKISLPFGVSIITVLRKSA